jgi:hypothetical protein
MMHAMDRYRILIFASVVAAAMVFGGVLGATVLARVTYQPAFAAQAAASPSPQSNENASHEAGESAAQEAAENNGTAQHGGPGGPGARPCGGHSNEDATHEKGETAAQEAAENAACPSPSAATTGG